MEQQGLRVTQNAYFSHLTHTKQLLLVTFCCLFAPDFNISSLVLPHLMDHSGPWVTQNTYFSLLTHTKQLLLMTFFDAPGGIDKKQ